MRPSELKTKIFLDSGDPAETQEALDLLGFLDGQTTNPTLVIRRPEIAERIKRGDLLQKDEAIAMYKETAERIAALIPNGSVSLEVYADRNTLASEMFAQAKDFYSWIPNAHIKFPTIDAGMYAARDAVAEGMRINMTLVFTQAQAAAVADIARTTKKGEVFVSPFVGRLDDQGDNGMDLIKNIIAMYKEWESPVEVLTASVRNMDHFMAAIQAGSDIITAPLKILKEWAEQDLQLPSADFSYDPGLERIDAEDIDSSIIWRELDITHDLTDAGVRQFADDWNGMIAGPIDNLFGGL